MGYATEIKRQIAAFEQRLSEQLGERVWITLSHCPEHLDFYNVFRVVAECSGVGLEEIRGTSRFRKVVDARYVGIYLVHVYVKRASNVQIARYLNRHHSTLTHAIQTVKTAQEIPNAFPELINLLNRSTEVLFSEPQTSNDASDLHKA